jgi:hypothetical protein
MCRELLIVPITRCSIVAHYAEMASVLDPGRVPMAPIFHLLTGFQNAAEFSPWQKVIYAALPYHLPSSVAGANLAHNIFEAIAMANDYKWELIFPREPPPPHGIPRVAATADLFRKLESLSLPPSELDTLWTLATVFGVNEWLFVPPLTPDFNQSYFVPIISPATICENEDFEVVSRRSPNVLPRVPITTQMLRWYLRASWAHSYASSQKHIQKINRISQEHGVKYWAVFKVVYNGAETVVCPWPGEQLPKNLASIPNEPCYGFEEEFHDQHVQRLFQKLGQQAENEPDPAQEDRAFWGPNYGDAQKYSDFHLGEATGWPP